MSKNVVDLRSKLYSHVNLIVGCRLLIFFMNSSNSVTVPDQNRRMSSINLLRSFINCLLNTPHSSTNLSITAMNKFASVAAPVPMAVPISCNHYFLSNSKMFVSRTNCIISTRNVEGIVLSCLFSSASPNAFRPSLCGMFG